MLGSVCGKVENALTATFRVGPAKADVDGVLIAPTLTAGRSSVRGSPSSSEEEDDMLKVIFGTGADLPTPIRLIYLC